MADRLFFLLRRQDGQFVTPAGLALVVLTLGLITAAWVLDDIVARVAASVGAVLSSFLLLPRCGRALAYHLGAAFLVVLCCAASLGTLALVLQQAVRAAPMNAGSVALAAGAVLLALMVLSKLWIPLTGLRHRVDVGAESPPSVRVASWNVFLRVLVADKVLANDEKEPRVGKITSMLCDHPDVRADVICLQECNATFSFRVHRLLEELRRKGGYAYAAVPKRPPLLSPVAWIDSGLVTASRLPITEVTDRKLPGGASVDRLMAKGAQCSRAAGWAVVNTHLQADYHLPSHGGCVPTTRRRLRQLRALKEFVDGQRGEGGAAQPARLVVCGDMNGDRRGEYRLEAQGTAELLGLRDPWCRRPPTSFECDYDEDGVEHKAQPGRRRSRFICIARSTDYILVPPERSVRAGSTRVVFGPPLSDHNLLAATVVQRGSA